MMHSPKAPGDDPPTSEVSEEDAFEAVTSTRGVSREIAKARAGAKSTMIGIPTPSIGVPQSPTPSYPGITVPSPLPPPKAPSGRVDPKTSRYSSPPQHEDPQRAAKTTRRYVTIERLAAQPDPASQVDPKAAQEESKEAPPQSVSRDLLEVEQRMRELASGARGGPLSSRSSGAQILQVSSISQTSTLIPSQMVVKWVVEPGNASNP